MLCWCITHQNSGQRVVNIFSRWGIKFSKLKTRISPQLADISKHRLYELMLASVSPGDHHLQSLGDLPFIPVLIARVTLLLLEQGGEFSKHCSHDRTGHEAQRQFET